MSQPSQINPLGKELPLACKITERVSLLALLVSAVAIMAIGLVFVYAPPGSPIFSPLFWSPVVVGNISLISFVVFSCLRYKLYLLTKQSALKNDFSPQDPEIKTVHPSEDSDSISPFDDNHATTVISSNVKLVSSSPLSKKLSKEASEKSAEKNEKPGTSLNLSVSKEPQTFDPISITIAKKQDSSSNSSSEKSSNKESEKLISAENVTNKSQRSSSSYEEQSLSLDTSQENRKSLSLSLSEEKIDTPTEKSNKSISPNDMKDFGQEIPFPLEDEQKGPIKKTSVSIRAKQTSSPPTPRTKHSGTEEGRQRSKSVSFSEQATTLLNLKEWQSIIAQEKITNSMPVKELPRDTDSSSLLNEEASQSSLEKLISEKNVSKESHKSPSSGEVQLVLDTNQENMRNVNLSMSLSPRHIETPREEPAKNLAESGIQDSMQQITIPIGKDTEISPFNSNPNSTFVFVLPMETDSSLNVDVSKESHKSSSSSEEELPPEEKQEKPKGKRTFSRKSTQPRQRSSLPSSLQNNPASEAKGKRSKSFSFSKQAFTILNPEKLQSFTIPTEEQLLSFDTSQEIENLSLPLNPGHDSDQTIEASSEDVQKRLDRDQSFLQASAQAKKTSLPSSPRVKPLSTEERRQKSQSFSRSKLTIFNREESQRIIAPPITIDPKPITKSPRDIHSQVNETSYSSSEKSASEELKSDIVKNIKQVPPLSFTFLSKQDAIIHNPSGNLSGKVFKDSNRSSSSSEEQSLSSDTDQENAIENLPLPVSQKHTSRKVLSKSSSEKGSPRGANSVSSLPEEEHFFEVIDLLNVEELTIETLNSDQQKILKEVSEQLDSHSIILNNPPTTPKIQSKFENIFDLLLKDSTYLAANSFKKVCQTPDDWKQFKIELNAVVKKKILCEEAVFELFKVLLPSDVFRYCNSKKGVATGPVSNLSVTIADQEEAALQIMKKEAFQFFCEIIPSCGKMGYEPNGIENALKSLIWGNYEGTHPPEYYLTILLPFFIRALQTTRMKKIAWKKKVETMLIHVIEFLKTDKETEGHSYLLSKTGQDLLKIVFSVLKPLESVLSDEEPEADRALIDFLSGIIAVIFFFSAEPVQTRWQYECDKIIRDSNEVTEIRTKLQNNSRNINQLIEAFQGIDLKEYPSKIEQFLKENEEECKKKEKKISIELNKLNARYAFTNSVYTQIKKLINVSFASSPESMQEYIHTVDQIFAKSILTCSTDLWVVNFESSKPAILDCVALGQKIDTIWKQYKTLWIYYRNEPIIDKKTKKTIQHSPRFLKFLQPHPALGSKKTPSKNLTFDTRAENIQSSIKKIREQWVTTPVDEQMARAEIIKALVLEIIRTARHRLNENQYINPIHKLEKAFFKNLLPKIEEYFLGKKTAGDFFVKSYLIHQAFWSAYPTAVEREALINRFILLFTATMKQMDIKESSFEKEALSFCREWLTTYEQAPKEVKEIFKLVPFLDAIPLLLTLFFAAESVDELRPFMSDNLKVPRWLKRDLNSLGLIQVNAKELESNAEEKGIQIGLMMSTPINKLLVSSSFPLKSTAIKAALSFAIDSLLVETIFKDNVWEPPIPGGEKSTLITDMEESRILNQINQNAILSNNEIELLNDWKNHKQGEKKLEYILTKVCVTRLEAAFDVVAKTQKNLEGKRIAELKENVIDFCKKRLSEMKYEQQMKVIAYLNVMGKEIITDFFVKLITTKDLYEPILFFILCGLHGTAGIIGKSDKDYFADFRQKLQRIYERLYDFDIKNVKNNDKFLNNHIRKIFEELLPK